jgi:formate hydrogenlyase subunit 6/NADH:ubiquinone oxidoreductase subunit I
LSDTHTLRYRYGKAFILDIDQCLVCHQCLEVCPVEAIILEGALWQEDIRMPR